MSAMINDVTSSVSPSVIKEINFNIDFETFNKNEKKAVEILQLWDGSNTVDAVAPTIYNKLIYQYLKNTMKMSWVKNYLNNF